MILHVQANSEFSYTTAKGDMSPTGDTESL